MSQVFKAVSFQNRPPFWRTDWYSPCPVCCPLQAVVSSAVQHLTPFCSSEISSEGQGGFREVPQENAALEPEALQSQQAASVCRQPRPGVQHSLSGVVTSLYTHTQADVSRVRPVKKKTVDVDMLDSRACHWMFHSPAIYKLCWKTAHFVTRQSQTTWRDSFSLAEWIRTVNICWNMSPSIYGNKSCEIWSSCKNILRQYYFFKGAVLSASGN